MTYIEEFVLYIQRWKFPLPCLADNIEKFYSTRGCAHSETRVADFECTDLLSGIQQAFALARRTPDHL